jgi:hypothetical protein
MNSLSSISIISIATFLLSCSNGHDHSNPVLPKETGTVNVSINLGQTGKLSKVKSTAAIEMTRLIITLSAYDQDTIKDTLSLTGGSQERTERKTYSGLAAWIDGSIIEWTLTAKSYDQNGRIIHSGDTTFTIPVKDTVEISLFLNAKYSMLVANYFPIRDSVTRCELIVDGYTQENYSFAKQSLVGDTVTLSYDYLIASDSGDIHHIELNVYGELFGIDTLLYTGDTTITIQSGEDANYQVVLNYVGPVKLRGAATMVVTLGKIGTIMVNGILTKNNKYYLTVNSNGNGMVSGSDSVVAGIPHTITAEPDSGYRFKVWRVTKGSAIIDDSTSKLTTVILDNGNTTIEGVFDQVITFRKIFLGEYGNSVQQTTDGGYIITGSRLSGSDRQVYLVKTTATGDTMWTKTYGNNQDQENSSGSSVQQTTDGGYIITGGKCCDPSGVYLIKTTSTGDTMWTKTFYGKGELSSGSSVQQTTDGGYIISGYTEGYTEDRYTTETYLIKTTSTGDTMWTRIYSSAMFGYSVQQTTDGGYIIGGPTLIKTEDNGNELWAKQTGYDLRCLRLTTDGGYILTGWGYGQDNYEAIVLVKTTSTGDTMWTKTFNTISSGTCVQQTTDGGYIITGSRSCYSDVSTSCDTSINGIYLIKTTSRGDTLWTKIFYSGTGASGHSVQQTTDGGYIITGWVYNSGICLIKTDEYGNVEE